MPRLRAVSAEGSSDVRVQPRARASEPLALDLSGSGDIDWWGKAASTRIHSSGPGNVVGHD
ncbi:hypothetical protein P2318_34450 [Myxococcaceae bacterium GXIMD 01537]